MQPRIFLAFFSDYFVGFVRGSIVNVECVDFVVFDLGKFLGQSLYHLFGIFPFVIGRNDDYDFSHIFHDSLWQAKSQYYSYLMASIGGSLAARLAGNTPKNIPLDEDTIIVISTEKRFIANGKKALTIRTIIEASKSPISPPNKERRTDSVRN